MWRSGGKMKAAELEAAIVPYIPHLVLWAMLFSVVFLVVLRKVGWLAPNPEPRGRPSYLGILFWVASLAVVCMLTSRLALFGMELVGWTPKEQEIIVTAFETGGIGFVLALVAFAPIGEELFFRRYVFSAMRAGTGRFTAYVVSAGLFALIHLNPSALPAYFVIAICATYAYEKTGTVWGRHRRARREQRDGRLVLGAWPDGPPLHGSRLAEHARLVRDDPALDGRGGDGQWAGQVETAGAGAALVVAIDRRDRDLVLGGVRDAWTTADAGTTAGG